MATVAETELKQKISELIHFIRDYASHHANDLKLADKREGYQLRIVDRDVILDFNL